MSSFPQHQDNVKDLIKQGFDMADFIDENGEATYESWGSDDLVDLVQEVIVQLKERRDEENNNQIIN
jgi:hypothetical protein